MARIGQYWRALTVSAILVLIFAWCAFAAAPQDNQRLLDELHVAHQGPEYRHALEQLNAGRAGGATFDNCSACHDSQGVLGNLIATRPLVPNRNCERCHGLAREASAPQPLGRPFGTAEAPGWLVRYEHAGTAPPRAGLPNALRVSEEGHLSLPLRCGACHPDHKGREDILTRKEHDDLEKEKERLGKVQETDKTLTDELLEKQLNQVAEGMLNTRKRASAVQDERIQEVCVSCHVPTRDVPNANEVLTRFFKAHDGEFTTETDGKEVNLLEQLLKRYPEMTNDEEKAIAFDAAGRREAREALFSAMSRLDKPLKRGCTPSCHSEHTGAGSGDSPPERTKQPDGTLVVAPAK